MSDSRVWLITGASSRFGRAIADATLTRALPSMRELGRATAFESEAPAGR